MDATSTLQGLEQPPPYLPFKTFLSAVQNLRIHGLPDKLDRTAWRSRSGGTRNQIISAFKFLGLIDDAGNTLPVLRSLADARQNSTREKTAIHALLHQSYPKLFELNLETGTAGQVAEVIASLGVGGTTRDRAVRFFIKAARFAGVKLSLSLTAGLRSSPGGAARETGEDDAGEDDGSGAGIISPGPRRRRRTSAPTVGGRKAEPAREEGETTTIQLKTGGSLTLVCSVRFTKLDVDDRSFVFEMIDKMNGYEQKKQA